MVATDRRDKTAIRNRAVRVLEVGPLSHFNTKVHPVVGWRTNKESAIARAINKPEIIIADEPTGNLDPELMKFCIYSTGFVQENNSGNDPATHDYRIIDKFPARIYGRIGHPRYGWPLDHLFYCLVALIGQLSVKSSGISIPFVFSVKFPPHYLSGLIEGNLTFWW